MTVLDTSVESSLDATSDFFDVGGHSLLLAKLASAISKETGVAITIPELLESPTVGGMSRVIDEAIGARSDATPTVFAGLTKDRTPTALASNAEAIALVLQHGADGAVAHEPAEMASADGDGDAVAVTGDAAASCSSELYLWNLTYCHFPLVRVYAYIIYRSISSPLIRSYSATVERL